MRGDKDGRLWEDEVRKDHDGIVTRGGDCRTGKSGRVHVR